MPTVLPQNFARVLHSLRLAGDPQPMAVTYGVAIDTGNLPVDPTQIAGSLGTLFAADLLPRLPPPVSLVQTEVTWQAGASPIPPVVGASTNGAGAGSNGDSALLPNNSAYLVHKRSSLGGKRGRGRMYFPGVSEGAVDNLGAISSAQFNAWNTSLATWLSDIAADVHLLGMCLLHSEGESPVPVPTLVTSLNLDPIIATQRQRLRR